MKRSLFTFILILSGIALYAQQDTVVQWTFPADNGFADGGTAINMLKQINTDGGTSTISFKNGATTKAAQATGWDNGAGTKQWLVEFSAAGYQDLHLSSKQTSGGANPGPRDFIIEFKIDCGGAWIPVSNGNIVTANDWTTGVASNLSLPSICDDAISIFIRWRMTSDTASDGTIVDSTGISKIDDIYVTGTLITSIKEVASRGIQVYPNPASGYINLGIAGEGLSCSFTGNDGRTVAARTAGPGGRLDLTGIAPGLYFIRVMNDKGILVATSRLIIEHTY